MNPIRTLLFAFTISCALAEKPEVVDTPAPKFPNSEVQNKEGKTLKFYDELIKGKVVAINFVFSSCPTICPLMQVTFAQLQKNLNEAGIKDITLISVTVDPATDTPARLKSWSEQFKGEEGWSYVTGDKKTIDHILKKLEVFTADINDHPSFILIGNDKKGTWKRVNSLAPVETLTEELTKLAGHPVAVKSETP